MKCEEKKREWEGMATVADKQKSHEDLHLA